MQQPNLLPLQEATLGDPHPASATLVENKDEQHKPQHRFILRAYHRENHKCQKNRPDDTSSCHNLERFHGIGMHNEDPNWLYYFFLFQAKRQVFIGAFLRSIQ